MLQTLINIKQQFLEKSVVAGLLATLLLSMAWFNSAAAIGLPLTPGVGEVDTAAQSSLSAPTTEEEVLQQVSRLSDKEARELLLQQQLDQVAQQNNTENTRPTGVTSMLSNIAMNVGNSVSHAVERLPDLLSGQMQAFRNFVRDQSEHGVEKVIGIFLLAIALGIVAELIVVYLTRSSRQRIANPHKVACYKESSSLLFLRFILDMAGLIAFIVVSLLVIQQLQYDSADNISYLILIYLVFFPRLMLAITRFLLAPNRPQLRLVHADDRTAKFLHWHQAGLFILMGFNATIIEFNSRNGVPIGELGIGFWNNLAIHLYFIYIAWSAREGLSRMVAANCDTKYALLDSTKLPMISKTASMVAKGYPYFLIAMTVILWLVVEIIVARGNFQLLRYQPHLVTLLVLMFIPAFDTIIRGVVNFLMPPMSGAGEVAQRAYVSTKLSYIRIGRVLFFGLVIWLFMFVWQINPHSIASASVGATIATRLIQLLIIFSIGYLIWEIVTLMINRKLAAEHTASGIDLHAEEPGGGEGGGQGASRLSTILPLLRLTLQTVIIIMTVLIGLSNIGINVTPLLAGAGVLGIAIGFGAQKLVQDIVSGVFFLIDDAFRQGEYISIDNTLGTVEKISLRSMQLRHHRGAVHTIPYGEIPKLTNFSRDWVIMKLKFTVPFNTDLNKVKKIFKQIGKDMLEIEEFKNDFLQPFKSQGVLEVNDVGIVLRGKFMAKPGTQFTIRKEVYNRVQKAFEENGIQFARKEVKVTLDNDDPDLLEQEHRRIAAGAAAAEAAQEDIIPAGRQEQPGD